MVRRGGNIEQVLFVKFRSGKVTKRRFNSFADLNDADQRMMNRSDVADVWREFDI